MTIADAAPLRVALLAPLVSPIAEPFLGGSQALLHDLARTLAQQAHAVTVFAADGSRIPGVEMPLLGIDAGRLRPARFFHPDDTDLRVDAQARAYFLRVAYEIRRRASEFDLVHSHAFDAAAFELLPQAHPRVIHTLHLPPVLPTVVSAAGRAAAAGSTLVTVSTWAAQRWHDHVGPTRTVQNGVPVSAIAMGTGRRDGWLFCGRLAPEKGLEDALTAAERAGRRLHVVGGVYDRSYYERVLPRLRRHLPLGPLTRLEVFARMAGAEGLLMPAAWDEPFGLTAVEAMAAGTPVAAYARGALPEVIRDQRTGYLVLPGDVDALGAAAARFAMVDPWACRRWVEERFDLGRMTADYVRLYREVLRPQ